MRKLYFLIYFILITLIPCLFNSKWLKPFPKMNVYKDSLYFSGNNAYDKLNALVSNYPNRTVGGHNSKASALWVKNEFENLGLNTIIQEFKSPSPPLNDEGEIDFSRMISNSMIKDAIGYNVIGISPGELSDIIVIGAHRDTLGTVQGAEDNGSGTATILELARVLTNKAHKYTYMFVSFDGEEVGLIGSNAFVLEYSALPIKLALIFDMTGYTEADTVGFYQYSTAKGTTPMWTMVLGQNILTFNSLKPYYFDDSNEKPFQKWINKKVRGSANTDSGPFTDKNIPSIGIMAAKADETDFFNDDNPNRPIHTPNDTMDKVSPKTMDMVGKFGEQYIKSIELNRIDRTLKSTDYLIIEDKILTPLPILAFIILYTFILLVSTSLSSSCIFKQKREFINFLKSEKMWMSLTCILALFLASLWQLLRIKSFHLNLSLFRFIIPLWAIIGILGTALIIIFRILYFRNYRYIQAEILEYQKGFLNLFYCLIYFLLCIFYNPFIAGLSVFIPVFIMGRVGYHQIGLRILWIIITIIYPIVQLRMLLFTSFTDDYLLSLGSIDLLVLLFLNYLLILFPVIYIISAPSRKKIKDIN